MENNEIQWVSSLPEDLLEEIDQMGGDSSCCRKNQPVNEAKIERKRALDKPSCLKRSRSCEDDKNSKKVLTEQSTLEKLIKESFMCTVCLELPFTSIYQCYNGHLICGYCKSRLERGAPCPCCRDPLWLQDEEFRNFAIESFLGEMNTTCDLCKIVTKRNALSKHILLECPGRETTCDFELIGCKWKGPSSKKNFHQALCPWKNMCASELIAQIKKDHEELTKLVKFFIINSNSGQVIDFTLKGKPPNFISGACGALGIMWVVEAMIAEDLKKKRLLFRLALRTIPSQPISVDFVFGKSATSAIEISQQKIFSFTFSRETPTTDFYEVSTSAAECEKFYVKRSKCFRLFISPATKL